MFDNIVDRLGLCCFYEDGLFKGGGVSIMMMRVVLGGGGGWNHQVWLL